MCDYQYSSKGTTVVNGNIAPKFCQRAAQFWVQSLLSTHNSHACAHHLARIVREIDHAAAQFDITTIERKPDARYSRDPQMLKVGMTKEDSNYARVTVKPYTRKVN